MEGAATITTMITSALEAVGSVITEVWEMITLNPLISLFVGLGIVGIGVGFFSRLKSA